MSRSLFQYHPVLGYHFIPGLKARVDHKGQHAYLLRVNQQGFRCDHEFTAAKDRGVYRVLLFGDSFTAGDGVSNGQRYGDLLEQLVPGIEVYNFGISGTGTDQQYLAYREMGSSLEHDLVVIAVQVENINRAAARYRAYADDSGQLMVYPKPYFELTDGGGLTLRHVPVPKDAIRPEQLPREDEPYVDWGGRNEPHAWLRKAVRRLGPKAKDFALRLARYQPLKAYDRPDHPKWKLLKAILLNWIGEARQSVVLFTIPLYHYVEGMASPGSYQARFAELREEAGVLVHDALADFWEYPAGERRAFRFTLDPHPTRMGHRVLAESLARAVRPLVEKQEAPGECR